MSGHTGMIVLLAVSTVLMLGPTAALGQTAGGGGDAERVAAMKKLCWDKDPKTAGAMKAGLKDESPMVRRVAIYSLERLRDPAAAGDIMPLLQDPDVWVRRTAAVALGKLGAKDAGPALLAAAGKDTDAFVRFDALLALNRMADPATQAQALAVLRDPALWRGLSSIEHEVLVEILAGPWITDAGVQPYLTQLAKKGAEQSPDIDKLTPERREGVLRAVPEAAATALALRFKDAAGEDVLLKAAARTGDDYLQQRMAKALGAIRSRQAVPLLAAMLKEALTKDKAGEPRKERWLNNFRYAIEGLGAIGDPAAVPVLEPLLGHEDYRIRKTAAEALVKIDGQKRGFAADAPAAKVPAIPEGLLAAPGGKRPPQFILLGVDDCANVEGVEALTDISETLRDQGSKAVFTMWLAPMPGSAVHNDIEKRKVLYQRLFDLGNEIAHHTLHHNPGGRNWSSLSREIQIEEIEGCTKWYQANLVGFTRPFTHKGGGGGQGSPADREFTQQLIGRQNFLYWGRRGGHPNAFTWPAAEPVPMMMPLPALDSNAYLGFVHEPITDPIVSDYPGRFDFDVDTGVAMYKANFEFRYQHPLRPPVVVNAFHDWGLRDVVDPTGRSSHRNEGKILKAFLLDVLVKNKDKYPDTYVITFRQLMEYVRTNGDLKQTLAIGNGQDKRNPVKPSIE